MDDAPPSVDALIRFRAVPTNGDRPGTRWCRVHRDQVEGQKREVARSLHAWIDHLVVVRRDLSRPPRDERLHHIKAIEPFLLERIEVGEAWRHDFEIALRIALAPAIERGPFHRDDRGVIIAGRECAPARLIRHRHETHDARDDDGARHETSYEGGGSRIDVNRGSSSNARNAAMKSGGSWNG